MSEGMGTVEGYDLISPGKYLVKYESYDLIHPQVGERVRMWFVITWGETAGLLIPYFCKVTVTNSKKGDFSFRRNSKFRNTMKALTGRQLSRGDRLSPSALTGLKLVAEVITVDKKGDGKPHPKEDWYSKVESLELEL